MINIEKLDNELKAAGILFSGFNTNGIVWDIDGHTEIQDREDVAAVIAAHDPTPIEKTKEVFALPIETPAIYADDIFVSSRTIKSDPDEALAEAIAESGKAKGEAKSLDLIARSSLRMVERLQEQVKDLEKRVKKLEKEKPA